MIFGEAHSELIYHFSWFEEKKVKKLPEGKY